MTHHQLSHAYAVCRGVARRAAKNFYYGFLVLPSEKRNALCAVYAFMRHADDISDDPALDIPQKKQRLSEWLAAARQVFAGQATDDPVLMALADAQKKFKIPTELF
ncbi:MAG TPA: squalene/phytoene synthase family protein, partial [Candidatus Acidoferrales bacterium]|nr:squalene/phytoene synthase family protein [Candidatus Acidoferrales bacterium]